MFEPFDNSQLLQFILTTSQPRFIGKEADDPAQPEFLSDVTVWKRVFALAETVGLLLPLSIVLLKASWSAELPKSVRSQIEQSMKDELISMAVLENEFENVLRRLVDSKIQVIILGGSILQKDYDPHEIFKVIRGFDLLVTKEQMNLAQRSVGKMGYRLVEGDSRLGGICLQRKLQSAVSGENIVSSIRVRWRILEEDFEHDSAAIWERSIPSVSPEFPTGLKGMIPEDKFVQLIRHGFLERMLDSPIYLHELDQLVRQTARMDWARVLFLLERCGAKSAGGFASVLLSRFWKTPLPQSVSDTLLRDLGAMKRRLIMKMTGLDEWFLPKERELGFQAKAFYLLSDSPTTAIRATLLWRARGSVA